MYVASCHHSLHCVIVHQLTVQEHPDQEAQAPHLHNNLQDGL